jgi:hypothetical protein
MHVLVYMEREFEGARERERGREGERGYIIRGIWLTPPPPIL